MSPFDRTSAADQADNHKRILLFAIFLLSLIFGVKTTSYVVDEGVGRYLEFVGKGLSGLLVIAVLGAIYWKVRYIPSDMRHLLSSPDSFVVQVFNRACRISWLSTFMFLSLIMMTTSRDSSAFPTEFYLNLTMFFMLAVFSVGFFLLLRTHGDEDLELRAGE